MNYCKLRENREHLEMANLCYWIDEWMAKHRRMKRLSLAKKTFLIWLKRQNPYQFARFRMTTKVHKAPWKTKQIICCMHTWMNAWTKQLAYCLQKLMYHVPSFVKDSPTLLMTCGAVLMYNNIDTPHAIEVIVWWLGELNRLDHLPDVFPLGAVIMTHNLFESTCLLARWWAHPQQLCW